MGEARMIRFFQGVGSQWNTIKDKHLEHSSPNSVLSFPKAVQTCFPSKS